MIFNLVSIFCFSESVTHIKTKPTVTRARFRGEGCEHGRMEHVCGAANGNPNGTPPRPRPEGQGPPQAQGPQHGPYFDVFR